MKAVILAGGSGTRLWPISRKAKPKQFHSLVSEKTLLQEAISQLKFLKKEDIFVATNSEYKDIIIDQSQGLIPIENIIVEPALRDTSACIGLISFILAKKFPDEVMAIIYADHLIKNQKELEEKLLLAELIAKNENTINIIQVPSRYPNPSLGYVKIGKELGHLENTSVYEFLGFTEKPDLAKAQEFQDSGNYLWNTGRYVWKCSNIVEKYQKLIPETYEKLVKIQTAYGTPEYEKVLTEIYPSIEKISIDYAIMEKLDKSDVRIISADLGWSDIGTWDSLHDELNKDENENITKGAVILENTKKSLIYNYDSKLVTTIGLENIIVVNTPDAILICNKNSTQDVKKVVEKLKNTSPDLL